MVWIGRLVKISTMTRIAGAGEIRELVVLVTIGARDSQVSPDERKVGICVIERGGPPGRGGVALLAKRWESRSGMIRTCRRAVGSLMARDAFHGESGKDVVGMTRGALLLRVSSGERELRDTVVESRSPALRRDIVALQAIGRKSSSRMVRALCIPVVGLVTGNARNGNAAVTPARRSGMTLVAGGRNMRAEQRKPRLVMELPHVGNTPGTRGMAFGAVGSELSKMGIGMARGTFGAHGRELESLMTGRTRHGLMLPLECKSGAGVTECGIAPHFP
jgi:hypothetical protein